jgi:hypothetical protein
LVGGEEGCVSTFDLDFLKNKSRHAIFEPKRITAQTKEEIVKSLDRIIQILSS